MIWYTSTSAAAALLLCTCLIVNSDASSKTCRDDYLTGTSPSDQSRPFFNLSVVCTESSTTVFWKPGSDKDFDEVYIYIDFTCDNLTTNKTTTTSIVADADIKNGQKLIDWAGFNDQNFFCTVEACTYDSYYDQFFWNSDTAMCPFKSEIESSIPTVSSSTTLSMHSSVSLVIANSSTMIPTLLLDEPITTSSQSLPSESLSVSYNASYKTQQPSQQSVSVLTSQSKMIFPTSSTIQASNGLATGISTELAMILAFVLIVVLGGAVLFVLIIYCTYRQSLQKNTYVVDHELNLVKQAELYPIRSVSLYSVNSTITVFDSLTLEHLAKNEVPSSLNDIEKAIDSKNFTKSETDLNKEDEFELDNTSNCSTVALQSPAPEKVVDNIQTQICGEAPGLQVEGVIRPNNGYLLQGNSVRYEKQSSVTNDGYTSYGESINNHNMHSTAPYIHQHLPPDDSSESAYVTGTSTSSETNTSGYLTSNFSDSSFAVSHDSPTDHLSICSQEHGICHEFMNSETKPSEKDNDGYQYTTQDNHYYTLKKQTSDYLPNGNNEQTQVLNESIQEESLSMIYSECQEDMHKSNVEYCSSNDRDFCIDMCETVSEEMSSYISSTLPKLTPTELSSKSDLQGYIGHKVTDERSSDYIGLPCLEQTTTNSNESDYIQQTSNEPPLSTFDRDSGRRPCHTLPISPGYMSYDAHSNVDPKQSLSAGLHGANNSSNDDDCFDYSNSKTLVLHHNNSYPVQQLEEFVDVTCEVLVQEMGFSTNQRLPSNSTSCESIPLFVQAQSTKLTTNSAAQSTYNTGSGYIQS